MEPQGTARQSSGPAWPRPGTQPGTAQLGSAPTWDSTNLGGRKGDGAMTAGFWALGDWV